MLFSLTGLSGTKESGHARAVTTVTGARPRVHERHGSDDDTPVRDMSTATSAERVARRASRITSGRCRRGRRGGAISDAVTAPVAACHPNSVGGGATSEVLRSLYRRKTAGTRLRTREMQ